MVLTSQVVSAAAPLFEGAWKAYSALPDWMDTVIGWFSDPSTLLIGLGPWVLVGVIAIVFVESGVLFPILPGDSLIFAAGLLHDQLGLHLWVLIAGILVAAFLGAQVGYWLGRTYGRRLFKPDARILKVEYLTQAEKFFAKYGGRALVIGRFVPIVRTFVPLAAGIARIPYWRFISYNMLGALIWGVGVTWAGSALGGVDWVHDNLSVIILLIIFVSVLPMVFEYLMARFRRRRDAENEAAKHPGNTTVGLSERPTTNPAAKVARDKAADTD